MALLAENNLVHSLSLKFNLSLALSALDQILVQYPFNATRNQISLTNRVLDEPSIDDGVGSLFDFKAGKWVHREADFRHFNLEFKESYFYELYECLQQFTNGRIGRVRLMHLAPKACYSMHRDPTVRYHFVLRTNPQAFLIFEEGRVVSLPANGEVVWVDTRHRHTAINGGEDSRIHLVMSEIEPGL
jgi:hypothetical protein